MHSEVMTAIEDEITDTTGMDISSVGRTLRTVLPDDCKWHVVRPSGSDTIVLLVLDPNAPALFHVSLSREDLNSPWTVSCLRSPLDPASGVVRLIETGERSSSIQQQVRRRTWRFELPGLDEPLSIEADRFGSDGFARELAGSLGWHTPTE